MARQFVDNAGVAAAGKVQGFEGKAIASVGGILEEFLDSAKKAKEGRDKEQKEPLKVSEAAPTPDETPKGDTSTKKTEQIVPEEKITKVVGFGDLDSIKNNWAAFSDEQKAQYKNGWDQYSYEQTEGRTAGDIAETEAARAYAQRVLPEGSTYLESRDYQDFLKSIEYKAYKEAGVLSQREGGEKGVSYEEYLKNNNSNSPVNRRRNSRLPQPTSYVTSQTTGDQNKTFQGRDGSQYIEGRTFVEKEQYERTPSYWQGTAVEAVDETINIGRETRNYDAQVLADRADFAKDSYEASVEEAKQLSLMDPSIREITTQDKAEYAAIMNDTTLSVQEREAKLAPLVSRMGEIKAAGSAIEETREYFGGLGDTVAEHMMNPEQLDIYNAVMDPEKAPHLGFVRDSDTGVLMLKGKTAAGLPISYRAENLKKLFGKVPTKRSLYGEVDAIVDELDISELYHTKVINGIETKVGLTNEEIAAKVGFQVDAMVSGENFEGLAGDHPAFKGPGGYRKYQAQLKAYKEGQEGVIDPKQMIKEDIIRMVQEATVTDRGMTDQKVTGLASQLEISRRNREDGGSGNNGAANGGNLSGDNNYKNVPDNLIKSGAFDDVQSFLDDPAVYLRSKMDPKEYQVNFKKGAKKPHSVTIEETKETFDLNRKEDLSRFLKSYGSRTTGKAKDAFDKGVDDSIDYIRKTRIIGDKEAGKVLSDADKKAFEKYNLEKYNFKIES